LKGADIDYFRAFLRAEPRDRIRVGRDDTIFRAGCAGCDQFIAGREYRNARALRAFERCVIHRGGKTDRAGRKPDAFLQQHIALTKILSASANVFPGGMRLRKRDAIAVALGEFLLDHDIGAFRHDGAGENARDFAGANFFLKRMSGG
jgi:hypothetical protein